MRQAYQLYDDALQTDAKCWRRRKKEAGKARYRFSVRVVLL